MYPYLIYVTLGKQTYVRRHNRYGEAVAEWLQLWHQFQESATVELRTEACKPIIW